MCFPTRARDEHGKLYRVVLFRGFARSAFYTGHRIYVVARYTTVVHGALPSAGGGREASGIVNIPADVGRETRAQAGPTVFGFGASGGSV